MHGKLDLVMISGELTLILLSTSNSSFKSLHEKFLEVKIAICMTVSVFVFTSIYCEGFICLDKLECQGTDPRWCFKDVFFLFQVPSSLLKNEAPSLSN